MLDFTPIITAVATAMTGLLVWFIQERRKDRALAGKNESAMERALLVLIRNQIISAHKSMVALWSITISEKQSFIEMHDLYISLGGNGPTSHLVEDLERVKLLVD